MPFHELSREVTFEVTGERSIDADFSDNVRLTFTPAWGRVFLFPGGFGVEVKGPWVDGTAGGDSQGKATWTKDDFDNDMARGLDRQIPTFVLEMLEEVLGQ